MKMCIARHLIAVGRYQQECKKRRAQYELFQAMIQQRMKTLSEERQKCSVSHVSEDIDLLESERFVERYGVMRLFPFIDVLQIHQSEKPPLEQLVDDLVRARGSLKATMVDEEEAIQLLVQYGLIQSDENDRKK